MNWRFMDGCSCILDHNCPVSLRVYASRIPPYITMQRVSRVDKRTRLPFRRSLFFLKKKGREGREGNERKKTITGRNITAWRAKRCENCNPFGNYAIARNEA